MEPFKLLACKITHRCADQYHLPWGKWRAKAASRYRRRECRAAEYIMTLLLFCQLTPLPPTYTHPHTHSRVLEIRHKFTQAVVISHCAAAPIRQEMQDVYCLCISCWAKRIFSSYTDKMYIIIKNEVCPGLGSKQIFVEVYSFEWKINVGYIFHFCWEKRKVSRTKNNLFSKCNRVPRLWFTSSCCSHCSSYQI